MRTIDVSNGQATNVTGVDAILSGALTGGTGGGLTKTGFGVLKLTANNSVGTAANAATTVSGGDLILGNTGPTDLSALPGTGANNRTLTVNSTGAVVLTGQSDPTAVRKRVVLTYARALALDASSNVALDLSSFTGLTLGAYSDAGGTPVYFGGSINPNQNTYRLGSGQLNAGGATGPAASAIQFAVNTLVLNRTDIFTENSVSKVSISSGLFIFENYNTYTGGTTFSNTSGSSNTAIGNDSAFGVGALTLTTSNGNYFGFGRRRPYPEQ